MSIVRTGIDILHDSDYRLLTGKRVGLFAGAASVDSQLVPTYQRLWESPNVKLVALFGAEHGFAGAAAEGEKVGSMIDQRTELPVYSLYGKNFKPSAEQLYSLDALIIDIQDVGVRFFTYAWTVSYLLEAAGENDVEVIILDRPNPIGDTIDGLPLEEEFSSFVGRYDVPVQHGMTIAELAQMINVTWNKNPAALTVVRCGGYQRGMPWQETGLPFVPPSPNMPHLVTAQHYPGSCLIEGTNLSEGRGTPLPFETLGAPFIDGIDLADHLNALNIHGLRFRPHSFVPVASKYKGELCHGVQAHITDLAAYRPFETWLRVIRAIRHFYPDDFAWLPPHAEGAVHHFDRLIGSEKPRELIDDNEPVETILADSDAYCATFREKRQHFLIYE